MTGRSKVPDAALGVRSHSGWAAWCVLAGDPAAPDILARGRMQLCDPAAPGAKQPFHHAEPMPFAGAEAFVARCRADTAARADQALAAIAALARINICCVLTASGRPLPDLRGILASHAFIHAAEGEFYRDAVAGACRRGGIAVHRLRERDVETELQALPVEPAKVRLRRAQFGKRLGPPWTSDEKLSALGAWLMLASRRSRR
jgi:hypothetical protein